MVHRSIEIIEISFEVEKERQDDVVKEIKKLYPDLAVIVTGDTITVKGDLHNYKRRDHLRYILSGGKHGTPISNC